MESFELHHTFPITRAQYESTLTDTALDAYVTQRLKTVRSRETVLLEENPTTLHRRIKCIPDAEVPKVAQKFVKPEWVFWLEDILWHKNDARLQFRIENDFLATTFKSNGEYRWEENDGLLHRHIRFELNVQFKAMFIEVGPIVEQFIAPLVKKSLDEEAGIFRDYCAQKFGAKV